jgi:tetraacyldisaccharide 4'-kinase
MSWAARLQRAWFRADGKDWLSIALLDISWVMGAIVKLRRKMYASGVLYQTQMPVPVIVVGNVLAGGVGKTPVVIELARHCAAQGRKIGIVSRGYGRKSSSVCEVLAHLPSAEVGDEPLLLKTRLNVPVFVGNDRVDAAEALLQAYPATQLIISDDGLQHLSLGRSLEIIVFDERGVGNGRLQPAGPLREHWPPAKDAGGIPQIVLYRGGLPASNLPSYAIERHFAEQALAKDGSRLALSSITEPVQALAGIGNPDAFFSMLREVGINLSSTLALPDHYDFDSKLSNKIDGGRLICTEKDAVKLWQLPLAESLQILAVPLLTELPAEFYAALDASLAGSPPEPNQT